MTDDELDAAETLYVNRLDQLLARGGPDNGNVVGDPPRPGTQPNSFRHWPRRARRIVAAWNAVRGLTTEELEQISTTPDSAARLAQLADAAAERSKSL